MKMGVGGELVPPILVKSPPVPPYKEIVVFVKQYSKLPPVPPTHPVFPPLGAPTLVLIVLVQLERYAL